MRHGKGAVALDGKYKGWIVFCDGESHLAQCGAFLTLQGAIDAWNRRA